MFNKEQTNVEREKIPPERYLNPAKIEDVPVEKEVTPLGKVDVKKRKE